LTCLADLAADLNGEISVEIYTYAIRDLYTARSPYHARHSAKPTPLEIYMMVDSCDEDARFSDYHLLLTCLRIGMPAR
jgi:hypothetical protein